jgi:hypothetical protein
MDIKIMEVTIRTDQPYWRPESIYQFLKQIQEQKGFKGFVKVHFEVDEVPEIVCYFNVLEDKQKLEEQLSKLRRVEENA